MAASITVPPLPYSCLTQRAYSSLARVLLIAISMLQALPKQIPKKTTKLQQELQQQHKFLRTALPLPNPSTSTTDRPAIQDDGLACRGCACKEEMDEQDMDHCSTIMYLKCCDSEDSEDLLKLDFGFDDPVEKPQIVNIPVPPPQKKEQHVPEFDDEKDATERALVQPKLQVRSAPPLTI